VRKVSWPIVGATSSGFALVQLDVSIVNVPLARSSESIGSGSGVDGLQWIIDSYAIVFASLWIAAGAFGDPIGARRAYVAGSLARHSLGRCGLAPGPGEHTFSRPGPNLTTGPSTIQRSSKTDFRVFDGGWGPVTRAIRQSLGAKTHVPAASPVGLRLSRWSRRAFRSSWW
jgi:MFS family permease